MMAPYLLRLLCVCLAVFFVIHTAAGVLVALGGAAAVRASRRMRPRMAARFLLTLRFLPVALGVFVVAGLCVPSYLWLESETGVEEVGPACLAAAILAGVLWLLSTFRGVRAVLRSTRHADTCEHVGRLSTLPGSCEPVRVLDAAAPMLALVGLFRGRVVVTSPVMSALSPEELAAALRHENVHRVSRDNLKRLLLVLTPGLLPGLQGFDAIEHGWARFSEWAADDDAVAGDPGLSVLLASALVRIARLAGNQAPVALSTSFLGDSREISARVDRLLHPSPVAQVGSRRLARVTVAAVLTVACAAMLNPVTLESAHRIIEQLIH